MIFTPTALAGAVLIETAPRQDDRGGFMRLYCREDFAAHGLVLPVAQGSLSTNRRRGTLRGLHYQTAPHQEAKLVRCSRGAIHDVIVDLRPGSATQGQWAAFTLSAANHRQLYVPEGFAHGFQTLEDDTAVDYMISTRHEPAAAAGLRWDDPALGIEWPIADPILSERDRNLPGWPASVAI